MTVAGNRFRPSGWAALNRPQSPSVADLVTGRAAGPPAGARAASWTGRAARRGVAAVLTPAGERILHRIGYRRVAAAVAVTATAVVAPFGMAVTAAIVTAPVTVPASVAATVLDEAAAVFGIDGESSHAAAELAAASADDPVQCTRTATLSSAVAAPSPSPVPVGAVGPTAETTDVPAPAISPIPVAPGGRIDTASAHLLVDPVLPGTSALTANVWFLYRLAGLGDWAMFTAAYTAAGLSGDDLSADAVLVQAQTLNATGAPLESYRLTAASLTLAGVLTGRLMEPYPDFRGVLAVELVSGCVADTDADDARVALPAPSLAPPSGVVTQTESTLSETAPDPVTLPADGETP